MCRERRRRRAARGRRRRRRELTSGGSPAHDVFGEQKRDPADDESDSDRQDLVGQAHLELVEGETADRCDHKRNCNPRSVGPTRRRQRQHRRDPLAKQRQHREHGTALDDNVEEIGLRRQPTLCEQQVPRRRHRQKLGDAFDDPKQNCRQPVGHAEHLRCIGAGVG